MHTTAFQFSYEVCDSQSALPEPDRLLLQAAIKATENAYAPYSGFRVGAAAVLANGSMVSGSNQENASFPAGICAERVLLSAAASQHPGIPILSMAISYQPAQGVSNHPIAPCGICRQSLQEVEQRFKTPIRLVLGGMEGNILLISQAAHLLPLAFTAGELI